ncbi:MAG: hypothetical protein AAGC92_01360 [Pseudomonadota bacterium]
MRNIYSFIDLIQERPGMYIGDKSLRKLETLLWGYCTCLGMNEIKEEYEGRFFDPRDFSDWLYEEFEWSGARGFAISIEENTADADAAWDRFFELLQAFRFGGATDAFALPRPQ